MLSDDLSKLMALVYERIESQHLQVMHQRKKDREFIDQRMRAVSPFNETIFGQKDADGRVVVGPLGVYDKPNGSNVAPIPTELMGVHVTLFGAPESDQACEDAMTCLEMKNILFHEPSIMQDLVSRGGSSVKWGADSEDSMTPRLDILTEASTRLARCYAKSTSVIPIKRIPGLGISCNFTNGIPLYLYELLNFFLSNRTQESLCFYIPKLENEEEASYLCAVLKATEEILDTEFNIRFKSIKVLVVIENPRAIFRVNEIMDELYPYFAGASLGWHDFLAGAARLHKFNEEYRIPVKADTNIVFNHVKAAHELVADVVGGRGGVPIGGMYGILPTETSKDVVIRGFIRDVVVQLKRGLRGFWVAAPSFMRLGVALAQAWGENCVEEFIRSLPLPQPMIDELVDSKELDQKIIPTLSSLIVADLPESSVISNSHPKEIAYNCFQMLQYMTSWLSGNACDPLPGTVDGLPVFILDDLATVERSRWEMWHEVYYNRVPVETFIQIAHEQLHLIRRKGSNKWHPLSLQILIMLVTDPEPVEFVTELLLVALQGQELKTGENYVWRFVYYFERCGCMEFAREMAQTCIATNFDKVKSRILQFSKEEIIEAASFHGTIGDKRGLDRMASSEQSLVVEKESDLVHLGNEYLKKFGFKFLVSANGKSGTELYSILEDRISNSEDEELENAQSALWEITRKRMESGDSLIDDIEDLRLHHTVRGASICIDQKSPCCRQVIHLGASNMKNDPVQDTTLFEIASLSKTVATVFSMQYFAKKGIPLNSKVNDLLQATDSTFRIKNGKYKDQVLLQHLMSHSALNMHYVNGVSLDEDINVADFLNGNETYGYPALDVVGVPGQVFQYSGGGFLLLQHLIERMENDRIDNITVDFLQEYGLYNELNYHPTPAAGKTVAHGYDDNCVEIPGTRKSFPAFAAGALGTTRAMNSFCSLFSQAYQNKDHDLHDIVVQMSCVEAGAGKEFMGVSMGIGVFVGEAGPNKVMVHQGANDGFRAIFLYCFDGPDAGTGVSIFANGDNKAMFFIAQSVQLILKHLHIQGIDYSAFIPSKLSIETIPQEEIVNYGYKNLLFHAFQPTMPVEIVDKGSADPLADSNLFVDASLVRVSNQRFARASNLTSSFLPVFEPQLFCSMGKVMDSWETARHNKKPYDFAFFELKAASAIEFVYISTQFHLGNQVEFIEIFGRSENSPWVPLIEKTNLDGHSQYYLPTLKKQICSEIEIRVSPDGGLSRIGLFKKDVMKHPLAPFGPIPSTKKPLQLLYNQSTISLPPPSIFNAASLQYGATLLRVTNEHYGPASQVMSPYIPLSMHDGFESARSRTPGHFEELEIQLSHTVHIVSIEMDFTFFVNNNPDQVAVFSDGKAVIARCGVKAFAGNTKVFKDVHFVTNTLKFILYPDGGVNRIRVWGYISQD